MVFPIVWKFGERQERTIVPLRYEGPYANVIGSDLQPYPYLKRERQTPSFKELEDLMKIWNKPQVSEQSIGLEVTSYMPAEIDII